MCLHRGTHRSSVEQIGLEGKYVALGIYCLNSRMINPRCDQTAEHFNNRLCFFLIFTFNKSRLSNQIFSAFRHSASLRSQLCSYRLVPGQHNPSDWMFLPSLSESLEQSLLKLTKIALTVKENHRLRYHYYLRCFSGKIQTIRLRGLQMSGTAPAK